MEKYLDQGIGQCPLRNPVAAKILQDECVSLESEGIQVPHFSIMPNHWHALLISMQHDRTLDLRKTMTALKGRSARAINLALGLSGALWQREWFDRWMRDDGEFAKCRDYIRANPVKAGLVASWEQHGFTQ